MALSFGVILGVPADQNAARVFFRAQSVALGIRKHFA